MLLAIKVLHKKGHTSYDFGLNLSRQPIGQVEFLLRYKRFYVDWDPARLLVARLHPEHKFPLAIWSGPMPTSHGWQDVPRQYDGGILRHCRVNLLPVAALQPVTFPDPDWIHELLSTLH